MEVDSNDIGFSTNTKVQFRKNGARQETRFINGKMVTNTFERVLPCTTVPKVIAEALGVKKGDSLCWVVFKNGVVTVTKAHK